MEILKIALQVIQVLSCLLLILLVMLHSPKGDGIGGIGGAAQIYARCIKRVPAVFLEQFGSPEAVWQMEVEDFPAVVTMDSHGRSLHAEVSDVSKGKLAGVMG